MEAIKNSDLLKISLNTIFTVATRRTSLKFAEETIGSTLRTLEGKYEFLKYVSMNKDNFQKNELMFDVSSDVDSVHPTRVGKAIEAVIRVVYNDLNEEAGLYFITEFKQIVGDKISRGIYDRNIDLDQVQVEQHYAYRRRKKKNDIAKGRMAGEKTENLLGYTWGEVAKWKHDPGSNQCTLYDKNGNVLDRLDLDKIIENYVETLSGSGVKDPSEIEKETRILEKEYNLLKLMMERDMDVETAVNMLHVSKEELNKMISKLSNMEMLHYVDYDTLELTDLGINFLTSKDNKNKEQQ